VGGDIEPVGKDICHCADRTPPGKLDNSYSDGDKYSFQYITDVDKNSDSSTFVRIIKNTSQQFILPVEWARANLAFKEVYPGKCARNEFSSGGDFEQIQSTITYGSKQDLTLRDVPLFSPKGATQRVGLSPVPPLSSRIAAAAKEGDAPAVDFVFTTKVGPTGPSVFAYTVTLRSRGDRVFAVPDLRSYWNKPNPKGGYHIQSEWRKQGIDGRGGRVVAMSSYGLASDDEEWKRIARQNTFEIRLDVEPKGIIERQVKVEIYDSDGTERVASGLVTVYLPTFGD
jgi:hypothetical protein